MRDAVGPLGRDAIWTGVATGVHRPCPGSVYLAKIDVADGFIKSGYS